MSNEPRETLPWRLPPRAMLAYRNPPYASSLTRPASALQRGYWVVAAVVLTIIALKAGTPEDLAGAVGIALAALLPVYLWLRQPDDVLPILPAVAIMHLQYFALPLVTDHPELLVYEPGERLTAALTVIWFLAAATGGWTAVVGRGPSAAPRSERPVRGLRGAVLAGLGCGLVFHELLMRGGLHVLGDWYGVLRAVAWNLLFVVSFIAGVLKGRGALTGGTAVACVAGVFLNVLGAWSSLFLVTGVVLWSVFLAGHIVGGRVIPLKEFAGLFLLAFLLHAGKPEMRERYWGDVAQQAATSYADVPALLVEWGRAGVRGLAHGESDGSSILERASLMQMLLRVQDMTPSTVPYLGGETYALIPHMLVPRVMDPGKPATQAGMDLLNVRYGVLTREETQRTAVGWGLMSEACANFGVFGVIACGLLLGLFLGIVTQLARAAPPLSARTMFAVAVTGTSVSLEADAAAYCTSLFQAGIAVWAIAFVIRMLSPLRAPS